jgi:hypothetical protein
MEKWMQYFPSMNTDDRFEVLAAVYASIIVVWDVTAWNLVKRYRCFEGN